ncbi:MAG: hypothetical protein E6Q98_24695 [Rhodospirillaceae bacterium]|nr:MAG: hypothetical protein E6Q98_24695 [Rhodospirillaceae bacterium]
MTVRSWIADNLRQPSFRGVEFEVEDAEKTGGPRTISHQYPLRDETTHEFIGQLPQRFTIEAVLNGADVIDRLRRLEDALYDQSPGRLVHPWYGELDVVVVDQVRTRKSSAEGRVVRLSITFERAGGDASPVAVIDTAGAVLRAADAASAAAIADFTDTFICAGVQDFVVADAIETVVSVADRATAVMRSFGLAAEMAAGQIGATAAELATIQPATMQDAAGLAARVTGLFKPASNRFKPDLTISNALLEVGATAAAGPGRQGQTPSWKRAATNRQALVTLARLTATIEGVKAGTQAGWESREQAIVWRDQAGDNLDLTADLAGAAGFDASWQTATDLRATLIKDVATRAAPLPRLMTLLPAATLPAVFLAYQIDGDDLSSLFDRADDLRRRNRLRHPGFVPGAEPLEVLING